MSATWKPCDRLIPEDFKSCAAWTFDPARVEKDETSDDTYVRPVKPKADALDDEVFVRATLLGSDEKPLSNAVLRVQRPARAGGACKAKAIVVLTPFFAETQITDNTVPITTSPALQSRLPIKYEVDEKVGGHALKARGKLTLFTPDKPPERPVAPTLDPVAQFLEKKAEQPPRAEPGAKGAAPKASKKAPARKKK